MKSVLSAALAAAAILAAATGAAHAQTINVNTISPAEARQNMLLALQLSFTNQCKPAAITDDESTKLVGLSDALAKKLNLNANQYEAQVEKQVFDAFEKDEAGFCKKFGPQAKAYLKRIP